MFPLNLLSLELPYFPVPVRGRLNFPAWMGCLLLCAAWLATGGPAHAQTAATEAWVQRFNGGANDVARGMAVDGSGNVYVTGSSNFGTADYYTIKYRPDGTTAPVSTSAMAWRTSSIMWRTWHVASLQSSQR